MQCSSYQWWPIFLGGNAFGREKCAICFLGYWLVQSSWPSGRYYGHKVSRRGHSVSYFRTVKDGLLCSFACATFISTVATLDTDFEPSAGKTIGIYAAVLVAQGLLQIRNEVHSTF